MILDGATVRQKKGSSSEQLDPFAIRFSALPTGIVVT